MLNKASSDTTKNSSDNGAGSDVQKNPPKIHELMDNSQTTSDLIGEEIDASLTEMDDIATIKFKTNEGVIFTKAFKRNLTIESIKMELSTLFSVPTDQMKIKVDGKIPSNDATLADLGVANMGIIELEIKIRKPYALNREAIYGHIPNIDVIVVRVNGYDLIVEIENQCRKKKWLGGYRHKTTNKSYHHAVSQTSDRLEEKFSISTQTMCFQNKKTNTPKTKITQTTCIPSITDTIVNVGNYVPFVVTETQHPKNLIPRIHEKINLEAVPPNNTQIVTENKCSTIGTQLRTLYREIKKWNLAENKKLNNWDEKTRRARKVEILNHTRMILLRIGREKRQLIQQACRENEAKMLLNAAEPKLFVSKTGEKIKIDTLNCQEARELCSLYNEYAKDAAVSTEDKMRTIVNLQMFFTQRNNFEFSKHVVELLQRDLEIQTYRLECIPSLKARIERFVFYYLQLSTDERAKSTSIVPQAESFQQYRVILTRLQNDEMNRFHSFTSIAFQIDVSDIKHLVSSIWKDCSALNECQQLDQLRLTRWQKDIEWSPWNCILLSKHEIKGHLAANNLEEKYDKCFISKIRNKHLQAKIYFNEISSFHEWFHENE